MPDYPNPATSEMITVADTAVGLTAAKYAPTTGEMAGHQPFYCEISVSGAGIRVCPDGTTPVAATTGHLMNAGDTRVIHGKVGMVKFRMIRETGTSALVAVTYYF
jgi:hypothetical protein